MNKKDIVERFLKEGHQLDASALDYFMSRPREIEEFIQILHKAPTTQQPIINIDLVRSVLKKEEPRGTVIKIIKKFSIDYEKEKVSISDYSNKLINYYETKKQLFINRVDSTKLLSINKIQKQKGFDLICMIREKDHIEKSVVVEDLTGKTVVYFENMEDFENLFENDVVGIVCEAAGEGVKGKRVIWPDVPLKRAINKTKESIYCLFISDFHMDSERFNKERYEKFVKWIKEILGKTSHGTIYIFILGGISQKKSDVERLLNILPKKSFKIFLRSRQDAAAEEREDLLSSPIPMMIEIEGIKILLCQGEELHMYKQFWKGGVGTRANTKDVMVNILKRRDLSLGIGAEGMFMPFKNTIIDRVPDIFASGGFNSPISTNYKGVTIITTGSLTDEPTFWTADLRTREINKVALS